MNAQRECDNRREAIAACVMGELDDRAAEELRRHLSACPACRAFHEALRNEESAIRAAFDGLVPGPSAVDALVHRAAAAIILGIYTFYGPPDGQPSRSAAFADVAKHIQSARTVVFKFTLDIEGIETPPMTWMFSESGRMRVVSEEGINVIDLTEGKMLALDPKEKKALEVTLGNMSPETIQRKFGFFNELKNSLEESAEDLGRKEIDGEDCIGFRIASASWPIVIWANAETGKPVRIEMQAQGKPWVVMDEFVFNKKLDESLFSMEMPPDYTLIEAPIDLTHPVEKDLVDGLRVWADVDEGAFPEALDVKDMMAALKKIEDRNEEPEKEALQKVQKISRAFIFVSQMSKERDRHYAGAGVKLGAKDTPIFWYRPKDSETYRVIYGDLRVEDVAPDDLPAAPEEEPTTQPAEAAS